MNNNQLILDLDLLKYLLTQEAKGLVGKICKRFELATKNKKILSIEEVEQLKSQIKELIYENFRDFSKSLETGKLILINANEQKRKEE